MLLDPLELEPSPPQGPSPVHRHEKVVPLIEDRLFPFRIRFAPCAPVGAGFSFRFMHPISLSAFFHKPVSSSGASPVPRHGEFMNDIDKVFHILEPGSPHPFFCLAEIEKGNLL